MPSSLIASVADTTSHRDRDSLNRSIASLLHDFLDAESVTIYRLIDDDGVCRLSPQVAISRVQCESRPDLVHDLSTLAALNDVPPLQDCVQKQAVVQYQLSDGSHCAALPVETERGVIGLLVIGSANRLLVRDLELVDGILRILKNHLALLDYGERDTLTGMLNRKTLETSFDKLRQRLRATDLEIGTTEGSWLGIADIDKFKSINDTYGHLFGDEVLLLIAQLMQKCFRGADQLFRFGGEEFVVVLDRATVAGAHIAFDRLRAAVEAHNFPQVGRVTISLGYSRMNPTDGVTTCVERADAALYYAKHHGRNNIRNYETLVEAGELTARSEGEGAELF